uniref:Secreted protein n=1 Tax=Schistosoma curassoni TaxID=6186 RepID=A0A183K8U1_9TREM
MQIDDLFNVCSMHSHHLFLISSSAGSLFVLSHRRLLLMVYGQWMLGILRRQLFINTCTFLMVVVVVLHVSAPYYSRTALTFVLKILTLILIESCFQFHMFFNCRNAVIAFSILAFTSACEPPCSSMMLPRYVKDSTSSKVSSSRVIGLLFSVLNLRTLVFRLCMLIHDKHLMGKRDLTQYTHVFIIFHMFYSQLS